MLRILLLVFVAVLLGGTCFFYSFSSPATVLAVSPPEKQNTGTPKLLMPAESAQKPLRDPFAPPAGYSDRGLVKESPETVAAMRGETGKSAKAAPAISLTGIAQGDGQGIAILRYNGKAQPYEEGEVVGPYRVVRIAESEVFLAGPGGEMRLVLR